MKKRKSLETKRDSSIWDRQNVYFWTAACGENQDFSILLQFFVSLSLRIYFTSFRRIVVTSWGGLNAFSPSAQQMKSFSWLMEEDYVSEIRLLCSKTFSCPSHISSPNYSFILSKSHIKSFSLDQSFSFSPFCFDESSSWFWETALCVDKSQLNNIQYWINKTWTTHSWIKPSSCVPCSADVMKSCLKGGLRQTFINFLLYNFLSAVAHAHYKLFVSRLRTNIHLLPLWRRFPFLRANITLRERYRCGGAKWKIEENAEKVLWLCASS